MSILPSDIFILSAGRSPIGKFNGHLSSETASRISSNVLKEVLYRSHISHDCVSEVILGQILTAGQGLNPARQSLLYSDFPCTVPAFTVNMACLSGLKSVLLGFQSLRSGTATFVLAGGQESMSNSPHCILLRKSIRFGNAPLIDTMLADSLLDPIYNEPMGVTAERVSKIYGISRMEQDEYSYRSHMLASHAISNNIFVPEIVPIPIKISPNSNLPNLISIDEGPRMNSSLESFSKLKPYWLSDGSGSVTPG